MVAATRSRVSEGFGVASPRTSPVAAAATDSVGFSDNDEESSVEDRCPRFNSFRERDHSSRPQDHDDNLNQIVEEAPSAKHRSLVESTQAWLKARLRSGKPIVNSGFKRSSSARVQLKNVNSITPRAVNDQTMLQITRGDLDPDGVNRTTDSTTDSPPTLKFGMYAGRVKANPLKYLATVLRSKIRPHFDFCNLLEVATEIHDEAKNKHNTTLRRIYDVVNVLEAAGLVERSNGRNCKRLSASTGSKGSPSTECSTSVAPCGEYYIASPGNQAEGYDKKLVIDPLEKRSTRGSWIRWLGSLSEYEERCKTQRFGQLEKEKSDAAERIRAKYREFEFLEEELRLTTELIKHNQNRNFHPDPFVSRTNPSTPPPEGHSCWSYFNFEGSSQTSAEHGDCQDYSIESRAPGAAAARGPAMSPSSLSGKFGHESHHPGRMIKDNLNFWFGQEPADEVQRNSLGSAEHYQSNGFPLTTSGTGTAAKGLRVPFVILQTSKDTNVDIELDENETSELYIALDKEYELFDYRELLSSMFPKRT